MPDEGTEHKLSEEKMLSAYQMMLGKLYNVNVEGIVRSVHPYKCPFTHLDKYMELELDVRFIDITVNGELPKLPKSCNKDFCSVSDIASAKELWDEIPLNLFSFDGFVIVRVREVTEREVINKIKNSLLTLHSFDDATVFNDLQRQMQDLVGVPGIHIALKPFFQVNNHLVITTPYSTNKTISKNAPAPEKHQALYKKVKSIFEASRSPMIIPELTEEVVQEYEFLAQFRDKGWCNIIAYPLFNANNNLLGVLGIVSDVPGKLSQEHVKKIELAIPLFALAIEKSQEILDNQVDK